MPRTAREVIAAAAARGAITQARAAHWQARADAGEDVSILDHLAVPAHARPPGRVSAASPAVPHGADPALYAANPLLEQMRATRPALVAAALREDPNPPRLFGSADLPPFTASGLDPQVLAGLPWPLRRPAAAMAKLADVYNLVERYADADAAPMAVLDLANRGANREYVAAMSLWLQGSGEGPADRGPQDQPPRHPGTGQFTTAGRPPAGDYTAEALHAELFGSSSYAPPPPTVPEQTPTTKGTR